MEDFPTDNSFEGLTSDKTPSTSRRPKPPARTNVTLALPKGKGKSILKGASTKPPTMPKPVIFNSRSS
jgi:hypothetical protein